MTTLAKTFDFATDAQGWTPVVPLPAGISVDYDSTNHCLKVEGIFEWSSGNVRIKWTGTWNSLGITGATSISSIDFISLQTKCTAIDSGNLASLNFMEVSVDIADDPGEHSIQTSNQTQTSTDSSFNTLSSNAGAYSPGGSVNPAHNVTIYMDVYVNGISTFLIDNVVFNVVHDGVLGSP